MTDTIYALSSGALPAAIAVLRISGPAAQETLLALAGQRPPPRQAAVRTLRDPADGRVLDRALVFAFPGPATATGEDLVELHLHGSRAVVRAVEAVLATQPGLRAAEAGEFTRRALANGRIDLTEAEGLADLLSAETEAARRVAIAASGGAVTRTVAAWSERLLDISARLEAQIDYADEDDVAADTATIATLTAQVATLRGELAAAAARPPVERLRDGLRVVLAGPPNSGKSSLMNAMVERDVAIATPIAGTTRDVIEVPVTRDGIAWLLTDGAGLRDDGADPIEAIGIARIRNAIAAADIVLWLGDAPPPDPMMIALHPRCDEPGRGVSLTARLAVSARTGAGLDALWTALGECAARLLPPPDVVGFNERQRIGLRDAAEALIPDADLVLMAEALRQARRGLADITHGHDVDRLLDTLFGRFCIGK